MRKFIITLIFLLAVLFVIARFTEMQDVGAVLSEGNLWYIGLAVLVLLVWILNLGYTYTAIFRVIDVQVKPLYMARVAVAAYFISIIAPSAGLSGAAYLLADARNQGRSAGRTAVAGVLYVMLEYIATLVVLTFGLGEMARRNNLHWTEVTASMILLAGALGVGVLLYLGMKSATLLARVLSWSARTINRIVRPFIHHEYLSEARAYSFSLEAAEGIGMLKQNPSLVWRPIFHALVNKALLMVILTLTFLAFNVPFTMEVVVAGFSIAYLFLIVSPTPGGIGIVEGVLTVALGSLKVPLEAAAVITLAFRGITYWLPLFIGMISFRTLHRSVAGINQTETHL